MKTPKRGQDRIPSSVIFRGKKKKKIAVAAVTLNKRGEDI